MTARRFVALLVAALAVLASIASTPRPAVIRLGAIFPLTGNTAALAQQEYQGVEIARDAVNQSGGVNGHSIQLDTRIVDSAQGAAAAVDSLASDGVPAIIGTYSSQLSIPASAEAAKDGITYWEAGAVADQVTGRGYPQVFRVGATGSQLGSNSANFAATQLASRLGKPVSSLRVAVVYEEDAYGSSVAHAAAATSSSDGMNVVDMSAYNPYLPDWSRVLAAVSSSNPDIIILASYIFDGVGFRKAMLATNLHVGALIGSTMAECYPEFGNILGADAVGVFASDRPDYSFNEDALGPEASASYHQIDVAWQAQTGREPTEEGLAGFTAGWALFHYVLPKVRTMDSSGIAAAARDTVLPSGTLPNGSGLRFATDQAHLGQNLDAAAVIWQWQAVRHSVTVWPPTYADGTIKFVPLTR